MIDLSPRPMMRRAVLLVLILGCTPAQADRQFPLEFTLGHDSNLTNARQGAVEREAFFGLMAAGMENQWPLMPALALQTRLQGEVTAFEDYEALSQARAQVATRLLLRPDRGFFAPTFALGAAAAWTEFDSRARDAAEYQASLIVLEQLTTRISARLTLGSLWREAEDSAFDTHLRTASLDLDWMLARNFALYLGYQRRLGDFTTTTPVVPPAVAATAEFISADDAFPGEFAVRQGGKADLAHLGVNYALSPQYSLDMFGRYVEAESGLGVRYRRLQLFLSLLARF